MRFPQENRTSNLKPKSSMTNLELRDHIIKTICKPRFKSAGFIVSGNTFVKKEPEFWKVMNIQSSAFNSKESAVIYLNLGFFFPIIHELRKEPLLRIPKTFECAISIRSNDLIGRNPSYEINDYATELISSDLDNYVLPFFRRYSKFSDCLNLKTEPFNTIGSILPIGLTLLKMGQRALGKSIIEEYLLDASEYWTKEANALLRELERSFRDS